MPDHAPTAQTPPDDLIVPPLRDDLEFFPAPGEDDGAPVWMVRDPLHADFLRADWAHFEILKRLDRPQKFAAFCSRIAAETTLRLPAQEIFAFIRDLSTKNLLRTALHRDAQSLHKEREKSRTRPLMWLLHHYLYFRVTLLRPDDFLVRTLPAVARLVSRPALAVYALAACCALYFLCLRGGEYAATITDFLSWKGALAYGCALMFLKAAHEFSHAYVARGFGNRVPAMGVAFLVMWPVPFCDVTDSWRMSSRRSRLWISAAGILCELTIAAFALTLWGVVESPLAKGLCFVLSSASLAGTLLVNLNPAMRFDGYYLFSDLLRVDNLFTRAGAYLRWRYRTAFLGLDLPDPEPVLKRRWLLAVYAVYAWLYRLMLYTAIALLVYHAFPKIIGIFLFVVEIGVFILYPAIVEARQLWALREGLRLKMAGNLALIAAGLLFAWVVFPLPRHTGIPAAYEPEQTQVVFAPVAGELAEVRVTNGSRVRAGDVLAVLVSANLEGELANARAELAMCANALRRAQTERSDGSKIRQMEEQLSGARAKLRGLEEMQKNCVLVASCAGVVCNWPDTAVRGAMAGAREELGRVAGDGLGRLEGYVQADLAAYVPDGTEATFRPASGDRPARAKIIKVNRVRERVLRFPGLSSDQQGEITVTRKDARSPAEMVESYFAVYAQVTGDAPRGGQAGTLWFTSRARSLAAGWARLIWRAVLRESGF